MTRLTPQGVAVRMEKSGTSAALAQIYGSKGQWRALLEGIASGTVAWLQIATRLRSVSDAGASEQLDLAVGEALEHHPENVLSVAIPAFDIGIVCSGPDVDDPRYDSYQRSLKAIELRMAKLRTISDLSLAKRQDECIKDLQASKSAIARFYGVDS